VKFSVHTCRVLNKSGRPINDITAKVMSKVDRHSLAIPDACGELLWDGHAWRDGDDTKAVSRYQMLLPGATCGLTFDRLLGTPDEALVSWFTDDDGFRWQLDQYHHLTESEDESVYLPLKTPRPLPRPQAPDPASSQAPQHPS
jgi:hypothetical protein